MELVSPDSLAATLDAVNDALFCGRKLSRADRDSAAKWIAARQGLPGSYAGMFAPTEMDRSDGIRLFTGEAVTTRAGTAHVLGEEAGRALILLDVTLASVRDAQARAAEGMLERLRDAVQRERNTGRPWLGQYCCGKCTAALWRHLAAGGLEDQERHLAAGMQALKLHRDGSGKWRRYPFWYTALVLSEVRVELAMDELRYAAPAAERSLRRVGDGPFAQRRRVLAERVLGEC